MNVIPSQRGGQLIEAGRAWGNGGLFNRLFAPVFQKILNRIDAGLEQGALEAWLPDGSTRILGGRGQGPICEVRLNSWRALVRVVSAGSAGWYRAWAAGEWESPDPVPLFDLFMRNAQTLGGVARARGIKRLFARCMHWLRRNSRRRARLNIAFHYDLGNDFYALWLDKTMSYSSALFTNSDTISENLETAQIRKIEAILDRLSLRDGDRLLEIGCGWGGLAEAALQRGMIEYDGITLSPRQLVYAQDRLDAAGLGNRSRILLTDYRDMVGRYDAIASVEMVEAVGQKYWPDYLAAIHRLLKPGGRAAIQYICINDALFERYAASADFIQTYIFPGGMLLSESRFRTLAEAQGLEWRDTHHFGQHYAETLRRWRDNFDAAVNAGKLPPEFDERFVKLWRYYLMYCEGGFRGGGIDVAQVTLVKA
ncbi:class I SAM-dependent methyltransferase [Rhizorhapis sp. SPR117]|uniref:class I SAM-dependent methyltransferase n=1 Tax=Rhizorhapis sp. SPR117 TaxID=2912611 RepID=UPI001F23AB7D|nr:cyclopropane-fatty-acyl-phospholipid synthase family protein [Rhizorhapis sp. SPR117]